MAAYVVGEVDITDPQLLKAASTKIFFVEAL